jgi:hypothetical protein
VDYIFVFTVNSKYGMECNMEWNGMEMNEIWNMKWNGKKWNNGNEMEWKWK